MTRPTDSPGRRGDRAGQTNSRGGSARTFGLSPPVAGAVSYSLTFVTGVVFFLVAEDRFVRFHAAQSVLVFGLLTGLNVGLSVAVGLVVAVPGAGGILVRVLGAAAALLGPVGVVVWIVLMYLAYRGDEYALPVVGGVASRLA